MNELINLDQGLDDNIDEADDDETREAKRLILEEENSRDWDNVDERIQAKYEMV
jgi:hypothetical protein